MVRESSVVLSELFVIFRSGFFGYLRIVYFIVGG